MCRCNFRVFARARLCVRIRLEKDLGEEGLWNGIPFFAQALRNNVLRKASRVLLREAIPASGRRFFVNGGMVTRTALIAAQRSPHKGSLGKPLLRGASLAEVVRASAGSETQGVEWKLAQLDALRGLAILGVFLVHSVYWAPVLALRTEDPLWYDIGFSGQRGVQLFFIVSAFTLFLSDANRKTERHRTINFFVRRFFRISPMLWLATILSVSIWPGTVGGRWAGLTSLAFFSSFIPRRMDAGAIGSWSIATEAAFYLTLPLLFRWITNPWRSLVAVCAALTAYALSIPRLALMTGNEDYWRLKSLPANYPVFLFGVLTYFLWSTVLQQMRMTASVRRFASATLLTITVVLYLNSLPFSPPGVVAQSAVVLLFVWALLLHPWSLFINRVTILLGKISFSCYLLHFYVMHFWELAIIYFADRHPWAHAIALLLAAKLVGTIVLTVPLAWLTYRYIETPGIRLGRSLIARLENGRWAGTSAPPQPALLSNQDTPDMQF